MNTSPSLLNKADGTGLPLLLIRLFLGGLFISMGIHKVEDPVAFLKLIRMYEMVPESPPYFLNSAAIVLPWLEIICGVVLILGLYVRGAAALIAVMLVVFTPAIFLRALNIQQAEGTPFMDIKFDCGCGGGVVIIWIKLLKNTGLFILALLAVLSQTRKFTLDMWLERRRPNPMFCHLCSYAVKYPTKGLCESCLTPPDLSQPAGA